jgi:hypothetical protein
MRLATLDGLKVESIAVRESSEDGRQLYIGTDDEHYGGILRQLPDRLPHRLPPERQPQDRPPAR